MIKANNVVFEYQKYDEDAHEDASARCDEQMYIKEVLQGGIIPHIHYAYQICQQTEKDE